MANSKGFFKSVIDAMIVARERQAQRYVARTLHILDGTPIKSASDKSAK